MPVQRASIAQYLLQAEATNRALHMTDKSTLVLIWKLTRRNFATARARHDVIMSRVHNAVAGTTLPLIGKGAR